MCIEVLEERSDCPHTSVVLANHSECSESDDVWRGIAPTDSCPLETDTRLSSACSSAIAEKGIASCLDDA